MFGHDFPYLDTRDLNLDWLIKTLKKFGIDIADFKEYVLKYLSEYDLKIEEIVVKWLEDHPEITTTVQDGEITISKLNDDVIDLFNDRVYASSYNSEIKTGRIYDTNYYYIKIPKTNYTGEQNNLHVYYSDTLIKPSQYAQENLISFLSNGGYVDYTDPDDPKPKGLLISKGNIISNNPIQPNTYYLLAIKDNRMEKIPVDTSPGDAVSMGFTDVINGLGMAVYNGAYDTSIDNVSSNLEPFEVLSEDEDNFYMFSYQGRDHNNAGISPQNIAVHQLSMGMTNAYILDGGGSTATISNYVKINPNLDNQKEERTRLTFIGIGERENNNDNLLLNLAKMLNDLKDRFEHFSQGNLLTNGGTLAIRNWTGYGYGPRISALMDGQRISMQTFRSDGSFALSDGDDMTVFDTRPIELSGNNIDLNTYQYPSYLQIFRFSADVLNNPIGTHGELINIPIRVSSINRPYLQILIRNNDLTFLFRTGGNNSWNEWRGTDFFISNSEPAYAFRGMAYFNPLNRKLYVYTDSWIEVNS